MLEVQKYLRLHSLEQLRHEFGIETTRHETLPLLIFNYGLNTPNGLKTHPIVRECRALVLEDETWEVVGRPFKRFFNVAEPTGLPFDWSNFSVHAKEDGSLMLLFNYKGEWVVTTKRSFAEGCPNGCGRTWRELFNEVLPEARYRDLSPLLTYVFEYCSPWTQVVRYYEKPQLFLLAAVDPYGDEMSDFGAGVMARRFGVFQPQRYDFKTQGGLEEFLKLQAEIDPTFEGVVIKDGSGNRLKLKSESYLRMHRLFNNGNLYTKKAMLPLMLNGEADEALAYRPSLLPIYFELSRELYGVVGLLEAVWSHARAIADQKQFALFVIEHCGRDLAGVLFTARKTGRSIRDCLIGAEEKLLKCL